MTITGLHNSPPPFANAQETGGKWEGESVSGGNYGAIQAVIVSDSGDFIVRTSRGTMTYPMGSPNLPNNNANYSEHDVASMRSGEFAGVSMLEIASLLNEVEHLRRKSSRLIRQSARDTAVAENLAAADEIRSGAAKNFAMAVVSGSISIATGLYSLKGLRTSSAAHAASQDASVSRHQKNLATTQRDLDITQTRIKDLETQPEPLLAPDARKLTSLKKQESRLTEKLAKQEAKLDADITQTKKDLEKVEKNVYERVGLNKNRVEARKELYNDRLDKLQKLKGDFAKVKSGEVESMTYADRSIEKSKVADQDVQQALQEQQRMLSGVQTRASIVQAIGQVMQALGQFLQSQDQADAKVHEAQAQQAQFAQDDANADFQNATEIIRNFKNTWEKIIESMTSTANRLIQA